MATIKTSIALYDGMTSPLQSMNRALNIVLNSFEDLQRNSGNAVDLSSIQQAREELARAETAFDGIEESIRRADSQQQRWNRSVSTGRDLAGNLTSKLKGAVAAYAGLSGLKQMAGVSDQLTSTNARLNLIVDDQGSVLRALLSHTFYLSFSYFLQNYFYFCKNKK